MRSSQEGSLPTVAGVGGLPEPAKGVRGVLPQTTGIEADLPAPVIATPLLAIAVAGCANNPGTPVSPLETPEQQTSLGFRIESVPSNMTSYEGFAVDATATRIIAPSLTGGADYSFSVILARSPEGNLLPIRFAQYADRQGATQTTALWPVLYQGSVNGKENLEGVQFYTLNGNAIGESNNGKVNVELSRENLGRPFYSIFFQQGKKYTDFINAYHGLVQAGKGNDVSQVRSLIDQYVDSIAIADPNAADEAEANRTATVITYSRQDQDLATALVALLSGAEPVQAAAAQATIEVTAAAPTAVVPTPEAPTPVVAVQVPGIEALPGLSMPDAATLAMLLPANTEIGQVQFYAETNTNLTAEQQSNPQNKIVLGIDPATHNIVLVARYEGSAWQWVKPGIRDVADVLGQEIGTQVVGWKLTDPNYLASIDRNANSITIAGETEPDEIFHQGTDVNALVRKVMADLNAGKTYSQEEINAMYDFSRIDALVSYAEQHNMKINYQHLVDATFLPEEVMNDFNSGAISRSDVERFLQFHIQTVMGRYKGRIDTYVVANEFGAFSLWGPDNVKTFIRNLNFVGGNPDAGVDGSFLANLYNWAHAADPEAKLVFNDSVRSFGPNDETGNRLLERYIAILKAARQSGAPIDMAGIEGHFAIFLHPDRSHMVSFFNRIRQETGVPQIIITEATVSMDPNDPYVVDESANVTQTDATPQDQGQLFLDMMSAQREANGGVTHFIMFGIRDDVSMFNDLGRPQAQALLLDGNGNPKPGFEVFFDALEQQVLQKLGVQ